MSGGRMRTSLIMPTTKADAGDSALLPPAIFHATYRFEACLRDEEAVKLENRLLFELRANVPAYRHLKTLSG
jgi:hypothetical protein